MYTIGIDLDSTIVDMVTPWLNTYNERFNDDISIELFTSKSWELETIVKTDISNVTNILLEPGFFRKLPPLAGAIEGVNRLKFLDNDVVFVTHSPKGAADDKIEWVMQHFRWANKDHVITTGRKELVCVDILIDDKPSTIETYRRNWPDKKILALAWPYNRHMERELNLLAESGTDPENGWEEIVRFIEEEMSFNAQGGLPVLKIG